ncbi:hypothetical protein Tco_1234399, partial [Tanacetum coccineum]
VYESEIKGKLSSSSNSQNVAFVSSNNSSSTNETVNTAHSVSTASSKDQASTASYADDAEEGITYFALMAYTSQGSLSSSSLDSELEEALKEKDDLKLKLENFEKSSKNLTKLINSQINAKNKIGLCYDSQMNKSEVVHSMFNSRESDVDDNIVNDRFKTGEGFHAVPPPYTRNYMPSRPDLSFAGSSGPLIEEWESDSDDDSVFRPKSDQTKPKFTKINFVKSDENVKSVNKENTHRQVEYPRKSQSPMDNRRNWNGMMTQKL